MPQEPIFLDTTIQVARIFDQIDEERSNLIEVLLRAHSPNVVCTFSHLEYKRVVLQNLALDLKYLVEYQSFFRAMRQSTKLRDRRSKSLVNLLAWIGLETDERVFETDTGIDKELASRAASYIRINLIGLWQKFRSKMQVVDGLKCQRASEKPVRKSDGTFDLTVHESLCRQKQCNCATFFQNQLPAIKKLCRALEGMAVAGTPLTTELSNALAMMQAAMKNRQILYDYQKCLQIGDVWIHLEAVAAGVIHFATTNVRESHVLCPVLGLQEHNP